MTWLDARPSPSRWTALALPLAAAFAALVLWWLLPTDEVRRLTAEGGPVERPTEWLWFAMAAVVAAAASSRLDAASRAALVVTMLAFGAREMDLHKAYTGKSVLKLSFYLGEAPWRQKAVAVVVIGLVAAALLVLLWRHARGVWQRFRAGDAVATSIVVLVGAMAVSKVLDRSVNVLAEDFGIVASTQVHALVGALEEIIELSLPLVAGLAWWQARPAAVRSMRPLGAARDVDLQHRGGTADLVRNDQ
jgi:hypothetical protein